MPMLEMVQQRVAGVRATVNAIATAASSEPGAEELAAPVFGQRNLAIAGGLGLLALAVLLASNHLFGIPITGVSGAPHYLYQAQSFLEGRWNLALSARYTDIVVVHGKNYIVYPPSRRW